MINPALLALAEDALHFLNPVRFRESVRHAGSGFASPWTYKPLRKGGWKTAAGWKGMAGKAGHTVKGSFWEIPWKGTAILTLPLAAYAGAHAPEGTQDVHRSRLLRGLRPGGDPGRLAWRDTRRRPLDHPGRPSQKGPSPPTAPAAAVEPLPLYRGEMTTSCQAFR